MYVLYNMLKLSDAKKYYSNNESNPKVFNEYTEA